MRSHCTAQRLSFLNAAGEVLTDLPKTFIGTALSKNLQRLEKWDTNINQSRKLPAISSHLANANAKQSETASSTSRGNWLGRWSCWSWASTVGLFSQSLQNLIF
jgi:hypothetical protein